MTPFDLVSERAERRPGASRRSTVQSRIIDDSLYRNALILIVNSGLLAGFGMAFWTLASRSVAADAIGQATALTSFTMFAATAVTLGLPNLMMKSISSISNQRAFVIACCSVVLAFAGTVTAVWIAAGASLGAALSSFGSGPLMWLFIAVAVIVPAVSSVLDATIIARRESQSVLVKNVCGSLSKLIALPFVVFAGAKGLFGAYVMSSVVATAVAAGLLSRKWNRGESMAPTIERGGPALLESLVALRSHAKFAVGNHVGVLVAMLPISTLPLIVVARLGAETAAYIAIPMMIVALVNVVPSMTSQSLFAELSYGGDQRTLIRKAFATSYSLLLPVLIVVLVGAPWILNVFGAKYSAVGTPVLRWLALAAIFGCANYIADTVIIARGRVGSYTALNIAGTISAMVFPVIGLRYGPNGFGIGWLVGQIGYALCAALTVRYLARRPSTSRINRLEAVR